MTAAYRLKGVGWLGGCVVITLGCYLVSLQVAAERRKLESVDGQIVQASREIRSLETEFDTRANLAQLERWNGETLALSAPRTSQFVTGSQLASFSRPTAAADLQTVALIVPGMPDGAHAAPLVAPAVRPAIAHLEKPAAPRAVQVALTRLRVAKPQVSIASAELKPAVVREKADRPGKREVALLDHDTLGTLLKSARQEGRR